MLDVSVRQYAFRSVFLMYRAAQASARRHSFLRFKGARRETAPNQFFLLFCLNVVEGQFSITFNPIQTTPKRDEKLDAPALRARVTCEAGRVFVVVESQQGFGSPAFTASGLCGVIDDGPLVAARRFVTFCS